MVPEQHPDMATHVCSVCRRHPQAFSGVPYLQLGHVLCHVAAVDVLLQHLSVQLLALWVVAHKALFRVWDADAAVESALQNGAASVRYLLASQRKMHDMQSQAALLAWLTTSPTPRAAVPMGQAEVRMYAP